jgi:hypothetical protein
MNTTNDERAVGPSAELGGNWSEWRPIESAPRDGSEVLVCWPRLELDEDGDVTDVVDGYTQMVTSFVGGRWEEPDYMSATGASFDDEYTFADQPTHWMHLPLPPNA